MIQSVFRLSCLRTGKRTQWGLIMDGWNSMIRYYKNNFSDGFRQVRELIFSFRALLCIYKWWYSPLSECQIITTSLLFLGFHWPVPGELHCGRKSWRLDTSSSAERLEIPHGQFLISVSHPRFTAFHIFWLRFLQHDEFKFVSLLF